MISSDRPITWSKPLRMPAGEDKTGHKLIDSERVCVCVCVLVHLSVCVHTLQEVWVKQWASHAITLLHMRY